jgi:hypothetical protein
VGLYNRYTACARAAQGGASKRPGVTSAANTKHLQTAKGREHKPFRPQSKTWSWLSLFCKCGEQTIVFDWPKGREGLQIGLHFPERRAQRCMRFRRRRYQWQSTEARCSCCWMMVEGKRGKRRDFVHVHCLVMWRTDVSPIAEIHVSMWLLLGKLRTHTSPENDSPSPFSTATKIQFLSFTRNPHSCCARAHHER